MKIYPYKPGSASAKALAEALGIKRIKHEGKAVEIRGVLLNWGASRIKRRLVAEEGVLNIPAAVARASNKLETFRALEGHVPIPEWTTDRQQAIEWLGVGKPIVARKVLNGHSGEGIVIIEPNGNDFEEAPLYTKYVPKTQEYRIHVFRDNAFFVQRKARNKDVPDDQVNWKVRNHGNGFIFAHKDVEIRDDAKRHAIMAVRQLGLDFGAVDIIYNRQEDKFLVLEVNTACGLEGTTLEKYVEVFKEFV